MKMMLDILFVALLVGFFALSAWYVRGCDNLMHVGEGGEKLG